MKLRTKFEDEDFKLGEVVDAIVESLGKYDKELKVIATAAKGGQHTFYYSSIEAFIADWEDAPKKYWYIDCDGMIVDDKDLGTGFDKDCKEIGNYFETEEEADKAVEKLKAWKRLKDKGFRFKTWGWQSFKLKI